MHSLKGSQVLANVYQMLFSFYISLRRVKHLPAQQAIVTREKRMDLHQRKCCRTLTRFAVSSLVFGYLDCVLSSFDGGYHPWMYGSDLCEQCFGPCRTMRNTRELNLLDLRNLIE